MNKEILAAGFTALVGASGCEKLPPAQQKIQDRTIDTMVHDPAINSIIDSVGKQSITCHRDCDYLVIADAPLAAIDAPLATTCGVTYKSPNGAMMQDSMTFHPFINAITMARGEASTDKDGKFAPKLIEYFDLDVRKNGTCHSESAGKQRDSEAPDTVKLCEAIFNKAKAVIDKNPAVDPPKRKQ